LASGSQAFLMPPCSGFASLVTVELDIWLRTG
jgi:hypothetical protein